jgi:hypothetical protein
MILLVLETDFPPNSFLQNFLWRFLAGYGGPAGGGAGGDEDGGLEVNIPGIPGQDYPIYSEVPTSKLILTFRYGWSGLPHLKIGTHF